MPKSEQDNPLASLSEAMADAVAKAGASTILVDARRRLPASGISYTANMVLTAAHVIERDEDLRVILPDGKPMPAALAGRDPGNDLALLRLESEVLTPARPAAQPARVGQLVLALGRPTSDGVQASLGIVSALGGPVHTARGSLLESCLRTDAIPYPGFSGGPLVSASGEILGLNTSGLASRRNPGKTRPHSPRLPGHPQPAGYAARRSAPGAEARPGDRLAAGRHRGG